MTPKFKIGDVVYLKKEKDINDDNNVGIMPEMIEFFGTQVTIRSSYKTPYTIVYTIKEDNNRYSYDQEWFDDNPQNIFNWEEL